jgi:hypothetical protein
MSVDRRLTALERELEERDGSQEGVVIKVLRIPSDGLEDETDAWIASHPEAVSKVVRVRGRYDD